MHSAVLLRIFAIALSTASVAQASMVANADVEVGHEVVRRQTGSTSSTGGQGQTTTSSSSTRTSSPTTSPRTTPSQTLTTTSSPPAPTATLTSITRSTTTTPQTTNSETTTSPTTTTPSESTPPMQTQPPTTFTTVFTTINSDGSATTVTSETVSTPPPTPGLSQGGNTSTSGMDQKTVNTIIGVVVGVGGAIILGVVGLVAWRIWGRKKNQEEADAMPAYDPVEKNEPTGSANSRTPFQSTLESYHAPTQVNASSNF